MILQLIISWIKLTIGSFCMEIQQIELPWMGLGKGLWNGNMEVFYLLFLWRGGGQGKRICSTNMTKSLIHLKFKAFTMLLCCQIVCWLQVWLLMCKCMNNVLFMTKGEIFYIKYLFYKLKKMKDVIKCVVWKKILIYYKWIW